MKRKLVIATIGLALIFTSVVSVATLRAFAVRHDHRQFEAWQYRRAEFARLAQTQEADVAAAQQPERPEPAAPPNQPGVPARPPVPIPVDAPVFEDQFGDERYGELYWRSRNAFRLGQDLVVGPNDITRDASVVFGDAVVSGRVTGDLVVIFGTARIAKTAIIDGDFVSIGGRATVEEGAVARRDVIVIGGPLDAPAGFSAAGGQIVIGSGILGGSLEGLVPYLSRGLAWGRVIVPDIPWVWGVVALFFLIYAVLNLMFDRPVRTCATTLQNRPLTTFGAGLLVLLLFGPICVLLAISLIGIAVLPFLVCALIAGAIIGKVAVARWIGMTAVEEDPDGSRAHAARSFVIGFAVLTIAYMIPVIGLISWAIAAVFGLGASFLSFMSAYRRESPPKPAVMTPPPAPPVAPPPAYPTPTPGMAFDGSAGATQTSPPPLQTAPSTGGAYAAAMPGGYALGSSSLLVAQPRALFRDRLAAFIVDTFAVFVTTVVLDAIGFVDGEAFFPLLLVYHILFWSLKQTTLGGIVCQLRLVRTDGTPLTFADALVRGLASVPSLLLLAIGALWILRDPERQAWHDKVAGTYVVKVPKGWSI
jgi:uncharacterized RDD family membrane protein YckC